SRRDSAGAGAHGVLECYRDAARGPRQGTTTAVGAFEHDEPRGQEAQRAAAEDQEGNTRPYADRGRDCLSGVPRVLGRRKREALSRGEGGASCRRSARASISRDKRAVQRATSRAI